MTQHDDTTPSPAPGRRGHAGGIARSIVAVMAGLAAGYATHDVGLCVTTAGAALSVLREVSARPPR